MGSLPQLYIVYPYLSPKDTRFNSSVNHHIILVMNWVMCDVNKENSQMCRSVDPQEWTGETCRLIYSTVSHSQTSLFFHPFLSFLVLRNILRLPETFPFIRANTKKVLPQF